MNLEQEGIAGYHERTKHHPNRFARSAGYLDWESEPLPFRRYEGTSLVRLPLTDRDPEGTYMNLFDRTKTATSPFSLGNIACFLELSLGLSAWKAYGNNSWALRMNPSSGNLHPVEAYLVLPPMPEQFGTGGVYHYNPFAHGLETRATFDEPLRQSISKQFSRGFFIALSTIHWREAWKYGERAFRYSQLDVGHAVAAMSFSAALHGWKVASMSSLSDGEVEAILGFTKTRWKEFEHEEAGPLFLVHPPGERVEMQAISGETIHLFEFLEFAGEPNLLSRRHRHWPVIDEASRFTGKPPTTNDPVSCDNRPFLEPSPLPSPAAAIIRKRRSATAFDAQTELAAEHFFDILDRTVPRKFGAPFDAIRCSCVINLLVFVHRVTGMERGLYMLLRRSSDEEVLRKKCRDSFLWERPSPIPAALPLYLLERGDLRRTAQAASCDQDIASGGAFAVAMIAQFQPLIEEEPYRYRQLHWEAGMIGQVLYLGSEAYDMRGTGMGCFFDDVIHELLGFRDTTYQDLYHFGSGKPVEDKRIITQPPYHHLSKF